MAAQSVGDGTSPTRLRDAAVSRGGYAPSSTPPAKDQKPLASSTWCCGAYACPSARREGAQLSSSRLHPISIGALATRVIRAACRLCRWRRDAAAGVFRAATVRGAPPRCDVSRHLRACAAAGPRWPSTLRLTQQNGDTRSLGSVWAMVACRYGRPMPNVGASRPPAGFLIGPPVGASRANGPR
jgi:hypothetical protein